MQYKRAFNLSARQQLFKLQLQLQSSNYIMLTLVPVPGSIEQDTSTTDTTRY